MTQGNGELVLSNRQRKLNSKRIRAEQAAMPKPAPVAREVYEKPEIKHADDQIIPGLSGRGAILRADNLKKLWDAGKLNAIQYSAGLDFVAIVEDFYASASGLSKLSDEAGRVGGSGDPIARYIKGRPARTNKDGKVIGYIPLREPLSKRWVDPCEAGRDVEILARRPTRRAYAARPPRRALRSRARPRPAIPPGADHLGCDPEAVRVQGYQHLCEADTLARRGAR